MPDARTITTFVGDKPVGLSAGDWILGQRPAGLPTSGPPTQGPPGAIFRLIPAGRFWTLQALEASMFTALTSVLVAVCIIVVVRSRPT